MANKSGGDSTQLQAADQSTGAVQNPDTVAAGGTSAVDSFGASALSSSVADQAVDAALSQAALGVGGDAGDDNINTNTSINIS